MRSVGIETGPGAGLVFDVATDPSNVADPLVGAGKVLAAAAPMLGVTRRAAKAGSVLERYVPDLSRVTQSLTQRLRQSEAGAIAPELLARVGSTAGGAALGATAGASLDDESPMRGAIAGSLAGAGLGLAASEGLFRAGAKPVTAAVEHADDAVKLGTRAPGLGIVNDAVADGGLVERAGSVSSGIREERSALWKAEDKERIAAHLARTGVVDQSAANDFLQVVSDENHFLGPRRMGLTWEKTSALADNIGFTPDQIIQASKKRGAILNAEEGLALRETTVGMFDRAVEVAEDLADVESLAGRLDDASRTRFAALADKYTTLAGAPITSIEQLKALRAEQFHLATASASLMLGVRSEVGRALNAYKIIKQARVGGNQEAILKALKLGAPRKRYSRRSRRWTHL